MLSLAVAMCVARRPGYTVNGYGGECGEKLAILCIPDVSSGITASTGGDIASVVRPGESPGGVQGDREGRPYNTRWVINQTSVYGGSGQQVLVQEIYEFTFEVFEVGRVARHVASFGEDYQFVVFSSSGESFDEAHGVACMHVFVNQTLH